MKSCNGKTRAWGAAVLVAFLPLWCTPGRAATENVPNADFTRGNDAPAQWKLVGGEGRWVDRQILEVTGSGGDSSYWRCDDVQFTPGSLYRFEMRARRASGGGSAVAGPAFANRDYRAVSSDWNWYGHVFRVPEKTGGGYLRLGQWHATGSIQFDAVRISPALPVHRAVGDLLLGEGETIRQGTYQFHGTFGHQGSNYHRTLDSATAGFNSDRWCFDRGSQVTYRFHLPGHRFLSGQLGFNVNYHTRGGCTAEASRDGSTWQPLATQSELGSAQATLPEHLLPAETIFVRLKSSPEDSSFQVNRVEFQAALGDPPPNATGKTSFVDLELARAGLTIQKVTLRESGPSGGAVLHLTAQNTGEKPVEATLAATVGSATEPGTRLPPQRADIAAGRSADFALAIPAQGPGEHQVQLDLGGPKPGDGMIQATFSFSVPDYYRADYGKLLRGSSGTTAVWWCDATHKIPRCRPLPTESAPAARLFAAKNDREAVQIVVRPTKTLQGLTAAARVVSADSISAEDIEVLRVHYHFVDHPTDKTGVRDWWPDALPPLDVPLDVPAGENQPLWVLVHVPKDAAAGDHLIELDLKAEGFSATVPIQLHVWDFTLPERNHIETAFGLSTGDIFRYHQLKTEADKRKVLDMYFQSFAEHRISPYDPTPLDPIRVEFVPDADPPRAELDFSAFDRAMARAVETFHFTGIRLRVQGMGGGTFHARYEPKIGNFGENTPEYQAMFSSYVKQLQDHLREKGWLDLAYIYWFDEPAPKDYEFVRRGMERLKKYAPGLRTMLTEQPEEALAGPVDLWCAVSPRYDHQAAEKRRAHGEQFWWYVCTGPKAPYCTLFIDHPATELRVWLWQTWQRNITGVLVWRANYWTSSAAYPDAPQDPYEDPMGYRSGYSTPRGVKAYWGNGDGRFIYPPLAAATPGASGPDPVIAPPVASIRWEMLREGIEDYECLYLLSELLAKKRDSLSPREIRQCEALLEVPDSITSDMTTFTTDPRAIYARRTAVAEAIERLIQ